MKKECDILVCVPRSQDGGLANYFNSLKGLFTKRVKYFVRGKKKWPHSDGVVNEIIRIIYDYIRFVAYLVSSRCKIVHINTYFGGLGLVRDAVFWVISRILRKRVIVFFRGWDWGFSKSKSGRKNWVIIRIIALADVIIVLSHAEKDKLLEWGFSKPIYVETTAVDERLLQGLTIDAIDQRFSDLSHPQILFMSRIERSKGIYELIDAFVTIKECIPEAFLTIAGAGNESAKIREYIESKGIMNICLLGFIQGSKKRRVLNQTHLFVLPSYSEGMSNAILEAMAFGIPVIATKVGGLLDFFEDSIHGYYIDLKSSSSIATKSIEMLSNPLVMREMAHSNFNLSRERFVASVVVKRLEKIYDTLL